MDLNKQDFQQLDKLIRRMKKHGLAKLKIQDVELEMFEEHNVSYRYVPDQDNSTNDDDYSNDVMFENEEVTDLTNKAESLKEKDGLIDAFDNTTEEDRRLLGIQ